MRQWIRSHLTYANIISTLCLFLVLGGGTAVALNRSNTVFSDDITDNQVYSADVRNDNLAGGGLGAADLTAGSVGTSEVAANSLNGGDINESGLGIVPNADKLDGITSTGFLSSGNVQKMIYEAPAGDTTKTDFATVGPYTLKGQCTDNGAFTTLRVYANGPAGTSDFMYRMIDDDAGNPADRAGQVNISANTDTLFAPQGPTTQIPGHEQRHAGTAMLKTGSTLVQVDFDGVADDNTKTCRLYGTATMGT